MPSTSPIKSYRCLTPKSEDVSCSVLRPALCVASCALCRVQFADRRRLTGTSQPNARGTLLPP